MTLSSRHRIRNSSPGGLRPSTLPLGHGGSPQYWLSHVDREETFFVFLKTPRPGTEPRALAWKAAVLTTTLGPPHRSMVEESEQRESAAVLYNVTTIISQPISAPENEIQSHSFISISRHLTYLSIIDSWTSIATPPTGGTHKNFRIVSESWIFHSDLPLRSLIFDSRCYKPPPPPPPWQ